ncbi:hypothetical protein FCL53_16900 [Elizabethkingia meningoseptica]|uniref:hypothetical protein n=1 Tax=Elizabethkingia meningoseptica TaxID=238 RepID=UPI0013654BF1|nr:hypothetical protein [Elizabethkingia meningoseptica]MVW93642.1 hypothetical protein [Elizabethkingia meningoseptica]
MSDNLAVIQSSQTISELQAIRKEVIATIVDFKELVKVTDQLNNGFRSGSTREIAAALKNGTGVAKAYNDENEKSVNINKKIITIEEEVNRVRKAGNNTLSESERLSQRIAQARSAEGKSIASQKVELQQLNKENKQQAELQVKEEGRLNAAISLYNKVELKLKTLQTRYNELATRKQLGLKLSESEEKTLKNLTNRIQKYDSVLKAVDATAGKYQRNVGNYKSGFNALGNSVNQITREMPAFANSIQTGFMAISNNLPILFDAISEIKKQNAVLKAEGKATKSVMSQLGAAIFSWGTALSIGVTLLTVYGKDIVLWTGKLIKGKEAINGIKQAMDDLNASKSEANKQASTEIVNVDIMITKLKDEKAARKDRLSVAMDLQNMYPQIFGNMTTEQMLVADLTDKYKLLKDAIIASAMAEAVKNKIAEHAAKALDEEQKSLDEIGQTKIRIAKAGQGKGGGISVSGGTGGVGTGGRMETSDEVIRREKATLEEQRKARANRLKEDQIYYDKLTNMVVGYQKKGSVAKGTPSNTVLALEEESARLEKALKRTKIGTKEYAKIRAERDKVNAQIEALTAKPKKAKEYTGSKLTGVQKDALDTLIASRDDKLTKLKQQRLDGEIDERKYLEGEKTIIKDHGKSVNDLLAGYNAKANKISSNARLKVVEEAETSNKRIFEIDKRDYDARLKLAEQDLENRLKLDSENPLLDEVGKIAAQNDTYQKLIDLNDEYYKNLIASAKENAQEVITLESERDAKLNDIYNKRLQNSNNLPEAIRADAEYLNEISKVSATINFEEQKRNILNNKRLSEEERIFALSQLERENAVKLNELEIERLKTQRNQLIAQMAITELYGGIISNKDIDTLNKVNGEISKLENVNTQNKKDINKAGIDEMMRKASPAIDAVKSSLSGLGLTNVSNQLDETFKKIASGTMKWKDATILAASAIGDALTSLADRQKQIQISALDEQLKKSQENTTLELGFIQSRIDALNNIGIATQEQFAQRAALEDEARVIQEQQLEREKMIAAQKARAEQRADAQKALINGAVGATQSIAQMGWLAGWPFALASLAFGVLQSGMIMARNPVPEYYVGTENAKAGLAWTQEKGREIITDKSGNIKSFGSDNGPQLTMMESGDKVFNADRTKKLLSEFYDSPVGTDDIYQRAMRKQMLPPIMNFNNKVNADEIADKVGQKFDKTMAKYSTASVYEVNGIIYKERPGKYPEEVGRAKKQPINIKIQKNGRD